VRLSLRGGALVADLGSVHRCLSSAVLGGGLGEIRTWLNAQVPPDYARSDPEEDLAARAAGLALPGPVVGMLTAADVGRRTEGARGSAQAVATVGVEWALAAAGRRPRAVLPVGTINLLVVTAAPLDDAGLVNALQTAVEAKAQALAEAAVVARNAPCPATGTATDAIAIACPPGAGVRFAGPATVVGADIAAAVHRAVLAGALADVASRSERAAG